MSHNHSLRSRVDHISGTLIKRIGSTGPAGGEEIDSPGTQSDSISQGVHPTNIWYTPGYFVIRKVSFAPRTPDKDPFSGCEDIHLTESVAKVVLQKLIPSQIRQLDLYMSKNEG